MFRIEHVKTDVHEYYEHPLSDNTLIVYGINSKDSYITMKNNIIVNNILCRYGTIIFFCGISEEDINEITSALKFSKLDNNDNNDDNDDNNDNNDNDKIKKFISKYKNRYEMDIHENKFNQLGLFLSYESQQDTNSDTYIYEHKYYYKIIDDIKIIYIVKSTDIDVLKGKILYWENNSNSYKNVIIIYDITKKRALKIIDDIMKKSNTEDILGYIKNVLTPDQVDIYPVKDSKSNKYNNIETNNTAYILLILVFVFSLILNIMFR